jgi:cytidine deaminase
MNVPSRELAPDDQELIEFARQIVDANTDGEYGVHTVGAAVRGADGKMYGGINVFHFTGGPCAELVALGQARASGARELTTIVAVGNWGRGPLAPCGVTVRFSSTITPRSGSSCPLPRASGASRSPT